MPESKRFDPLGWFISACFTLLVGAVALVAAIHLIQSVWVWLIRIAGALIAIGLVATIAAWWYRRRPW